MNRRILSLLPVVTLACAANSAQSSRASASGGSTGDGVGGGSSIITSSGGGDSLVPSCSSNCTDFQTTAILDGAATADVPAKFGDPNAGGPAAACIIEPAPGSMVPRNWWRPRVRFAAQPGETLFGSACTLTWR